VKMKTISAMKVTAAGVMDKCGLSESTRRQ
jgi:hypothetical protein